MFVVPFFACISQPEEQQFICMLEDGKHTQILHILQTATRRRDNNSAKSSVEMTVVLRLRILIKTHSVTSFSVFACMWESGIYAVNSCVREEEEIATHTCFFSLLFS